MVEESRWSWWRRRSPELVEEWTRRRRSPELVEKEEKVAGVGGERGEGHRKFTGVGRRRRRRRREEVKERRRDEKGGEVEEKEKRGDEK